MGRFIAKISTIAAPGMAALSVLSALGLAQAAQAAPAQSKSDKPAVLATIRIGDLDLSRPQDARLLKARIATTSAAVCGARIRAERLDRWSARACHIDIRDEVHSKLSQGQARALRAVGG
jgi:UrcA family protein